MSMYLFFGKGSRTPARVHSRAAQSSGGAGGGEGGGGGGGAEGGAAAVDVKCHDALNIVASDATGHCPTVLGCQPDEM